MIAPAEGEKLHQKQERLSEIIYNSPTSMPPSRYAFLITNQCNLKCKWCFLEKNKKKNVMETQNWINLTKQLPDYARVTITGGEPFLYKGFKEVFSYIASHFDCNIISNGLLLTNELSELLLSFPKLGILGISVDNMGNTIRDVKPKQWKRMEKEIKNFIRKRNEKNSNCVLNIKTTISDENARELFTTHEYCVEELKSDYHDFQFLKGSPIQHSDKIVSFEEILKMPKTQTYEKFDIIKQQLEKVRQYNIKTGAKGFMLIQPTPDALCSKDPLPSIDYLNKPQVKENYKPCQIPWSDLQINPDGSAFPCLLINLGNVKESSLIEIINGKQMGRFRKVIKDNKLVPACNRCCYLKYDRGKKLQEGR